MAGRANPFMGWTIGSVGVILAYAAYKNKAPLSVFSTAVGAPGATVTPIQTKFGSGGSGNATATANSPAELNPVSGANIGSQNMIPVSGSAQQRSQALQSRSIQPNLVTIPGTKFQLDQMAEQSFEAVQRQLGFNIPLSGTFRSYAQQAAGYAKAPDRFAPPGHSLHEVGLAIDIANNVPGGFDNPALVAALQNAGWYRRGKIINGRNEPWHWSYGVPG